MNPTHFQKLLFVRSYRTERSRDLFTEAARTEDFQSFDAQVEPTRASFGIVQPFGQLALANGSVDCLQNFHRDSQMVPSW